MKKRNFSLVTITAIVLLAVAAIYYWDSVGLKENRKYRLVYSDITPPLTTEELIEIDRSSRFANSSAPINVTLDKDIRIGLCKGNWLRYRHQTVKRPRQRREHYSYLVSYLAGKSIITGGHCFKLIETKYIPRQTIAKAYGAKKEHIDTMMSFLKWEGDDAFILRAVRFQRDFLISKIQSNELHVREIKYRDDLDHWGRPIKKKEVKDS